MAKLLTTTEAAERLGISTPRVRQLVLENRLPAQKLGRDLFIDEKDLKLVEARKVGRPRKKRQETIKK
ncbi:MAG TPA: helix-turn-helix domain-containing protein [Nitrososphaera sp.]|nr:helix-turn-helix domain-containing protein [Nitrososphaera sp.]